MKLKILYYRSSSGRKIIEDYIRNQDENIKAYILSFLVKFENDPIYRREPFSKKIDKDIYEIRIKIRDCFRLLYGFIYKDSIIILHIFKKKTNKIPKKELRIARDRLKLFK